MAQEKAEMFGFDEKKRIDLVEIARLLDIGNCWTMKKSELIEVIIKNRDKYFEILCKNKEVGILRGTLDFDSYESLLKNMCTKNERKYFESFYEKFEDESLEFTAVALDSKRFKNRFFLLFIFDDGYFYWTEEITFSSIFSMEFYENCVINNEEDEDYSQKSTLEDFISTVNKEKFSMTKIREIIFKYMEI